MVDEADLEVNVLDFLHKSFALERLATVDGVEYAVFHRRETESESRLRPSVIRLFLAVPRPLIVFDAAEDLLRLAPDGKTPGPRPPGVAHEAAADAPEFEEQGIGWIRIPVPNGIAYLPRDHTDRLATPTARAALGFG